MRSIKPGRAPSMMGGLSGIAAAVFGVIWIIFALSIGAPWPFALFGVVFIFVAIAGAIYNFKNATSQNRYSEFDITEGNEEIDPLNQMYSSNIPSQPHAANAAGRFCPYCGTPVQGDFEFCNVCGKKLP